MSAARPARVLAFLLDALDRYSGLPGAVGGRCFSDGWRAAPPDEKTVAGRCSARHRHRRAVL